MIDCESFVQNKKNKIKEYVLVNKLRNYTLVVIQVGDNAASNSYIKGKINDCDEVGIQCKLLKYNDNVETKEVIGDILKYNNDINVKGIIVQLPLPDHLDKSAIIKSIDISKDVDGFNVLSKFTPCTPKGIMTLLKDDLQIELKGKVCCVLGRSELVGKPLAKLMIENGCTLISCNSNTKDISNWIKQSDIIISAVGKPNLITKKMVNDKQIIIDVGINKDINNKLCGDCDKELYGIIQNITPVPKGMGLYTRLSLLENVINNQY